jgi:hypothetical protein
MSHATPRVHVIILSKRRQRYGSGCRYGKKRVISVFLLTTERRTSFNSTCSLIELGPRCEMFKAIDSCSTKGFGNST